MDSLEISGFYESYPQPTQWGHEQSNELRQQKHTHTHTPLFCLQACVRDAQLICLHNGIPMTICFSSYIFGLRLNDMMDLPDLPIVTHEIL